MTFTLSAKAKLLSQQQNAEIQIILEIEGIPIIFGAIQVKKLVRIGDDGLLIGGFTIGNTSPNPNSRDYISLNGTSKSITSQLYQDKGGTGSISSVNIELVDKNNELSSLFSPGQTIEDVLSAKASVYISFKNGAHPEDSIPIFHGIIDTISFPAGSCLLGIAHPNKLKSREIYQKIQTKITSAINDTDTTIPLEISSGIFESQDALTSYVRIEDEIIEIGNISGTDLVSCTRGALNTTAIAHDIETELETFYKLEGKPLDLALKLMLSSEDQFYIENVSVDRIGQDSDGTIIPNSVFVGNAKLELIEGVTIGDLVTIENSINPSNDVVDSIIVSIEETSGGEYLVLSDTLVTEIESTAILKIKSIYNTLPQGMNMSPSQVDVSGHKEIKDRFGSTFPDYVFYLKDSVKGLDFLDSEVYFPSGLYSLPRKGRAGVGFTNTPLALENLVTLDERNITNPDQLVIHRSISSNFYNAIVWKFNEDTLEDKFLAGEITIDEDSHARLKTGNKPLTIVSKGLRDNVSTRTLINSMTSRFLNRYKFATQIVKNIKILFKVGYNLEVGDIVLFGSENMNIHDYKRGDRKFQSRLMEVINKRLNITTGEITVDLLDTAYEQDGVFGVIAPSSIVGTGSSTTEIIITKSFGTGEFEKEKDKWETYINRPILIRSLDWTYQEITTLKGFSPSNDLKMIVNAISTPPSSGYIVDIPSFENSDGAERISHCFFTPQVSIVSGISNFIFEVDDATIFFVGSIVRIHSLDYTQDSIESTVTDITGSQITVDKDLGLTPSTGQKVDLIGFIDTNQVPYRIA